MNLAAIRARHNWTQAQLAEKLGVSPGHIGDLESSPPRRRMTVAMAARLEAITGETGLVQSVASEIAKRATRKPTKRRVTT